MKRIKVSIKFMTRLSQEAEDLFALFLLPWFLLLLPWRWGWPLAKKLCGWLPLYNRQAQQALHNCQTIQPPTDSKQWLAEYRLTILLDHLDLWLSMLAPGRFYRQMQIENSLPEKGPFVLLGLHWGAGFPILRELHRNAPETVYILRQRSRHETQKRWFQGRYIHYRRAHLAKLFPDQRYTPGGYPRMLIKTLQSRKSILMLGDVPAVAGEQTLSVQLLGQPAQISSGFLRLLIKMAIPVVFFDVSMTTEGQRRLHLQTPQTFSEQDGLIKNFETLFDDCLSRQSSAWQLWFAANQIFPELQRKK